MSTFRQSLNLFANRALSPAALAANLAAAAKLRRDELIAAGRASPRYRRYVDGAAEAPEEQVRADGVIRYDFDYIGDAVAFALAELQARSPVRRGRYRDSFIAAVDGRPIAAAAFQPKSVPPDAEVLIYNSQLYSRKVDVQLVGGRSLRFSVPPGLFNDVAKLVRGRFGNTLTVTRLANIKIPGQPRTKAGRVVDSPALSITKLK